MTPEAAIVAVLDVIDGAAVPYMLVARRPLLEEIRREVPSS